MTALILLAGLHAVHGQSLYIDYSPQPKAAELLRHTVCVLDPHATVDLKPVQQKGRRVLAYVSLVEIAKGSPAAAAMQKRGVPLAGSNEDWHSHVLDVRNRAWSEFIVEDCAAGAVAKGYDGFFLDTADSVVRIAGKDQVQLDACRAALAEVIRDLKKRWPGKDIVLNRGFELVPQLKTQLSGVLVESVYQGFDPATKRYLATGSEGVRWLEARIREVQALKLPIYAVDYVPPRQKDLAAATARRLRELGCIPLVTTPDLRGRVLAPGTEVDE